MKPCIPIRILILWLGISCCLVARSNKITVSNISLTGRNIGAQTVFVQFNLNWQNSWRTSAAPFNWDAAWVFVKYKVGNGDWKHATLASSGHTIPSGATSTQNDAAGIFIYRNADGTGAFSPSGIQLLWNYGTDGVDYNYKITVRVYAVEMVYNQVGGFQAGSGAINNGELRKANDITSSGTASTFTITGTTPTVQGNSSSATPTNIGAYNNTATDLTGTSTASLASGYPTGFNAFYAMKYEISQQQYVDFLNTLTYTQQAARTIVAPNNAAGTPALVASNANRNGIDIQTPGTSSTVPAVYACNLNGNSTYNESDDGQSIACNYLSWDDLIAYLDWAALRPMTELEYEKSCRGSQNPASNEFAWGNTSATALSGLSNASTMSETASNTSSNIAYNNSFTSGPVRTGIFATSSTARATSGSGYYGNMELSGNLWERVVTLGNATGRTFSGANGNGTLNSSGNADVSGWPAAAGAGWKGGSWLNITTNSATASDRTQAANVNNTRAADAGGRGVRTISSGIVTNGLVLWLDAGISPSYSGSGTTWTDLSGNKNNGTLTNGPTFNSTNGGVFSFARASNQYISTTFTSGNVYTFSCWFNQSVFSGNSSDYYDIFILNVPNYFLVATNGGSGLLTFWNSADGLNGQTLGTPTLSPNTWYNVTCVREGQSVSSGFKVYINGALTGSSNTANTWTTSSTLWIGSRNDFANQGFQGSQGLLMAYNRALTAGEVLQNFNAQKARFGL
ncbi:MAG: LamG-like jellyroll fold domain-containing protein [Chitinophagia bacterium]